MAKGVSATTWAEGHWRRYGGLWALLNQNWVGNEVRIRLNLDSKELFRYNPSKFTVRSSLKVAGPVRRLALVVAIPILLWGALEASGLLKVRAPGDSQSLTSRPESSAQPAPLVPAGHPAALIQEPPEPQRIPQVDSPPSDTGRRRQRIPVPANLSQIMQMEAAIQKNARAYGVDESLVWAVVRQESGFNPGAVSPKGAMGLMQLMPGTAAAVGVTDPFDVDQNLAGGIKYLV